MKRNKLATSLLAAIACMALASCGQGKGGNSNAPQGDGATERTEKKKIAIGLYTLTGNHKTALESYLNTLKDSNNVEFTYFETGWGASTLIPAIQQQIAAGADAIITTMDGGQEALDVCDDAEVYYAGYLNDMNNTHDTIKNEEYYLGTAVDGRFEGYAWGQHVAERVIASGKKNVGMLKYPAYAYPHQDEMDSEFRKVINEYNQTAAADQKITVQAETTTVEFGAFDVQAYFTANPNIDTIYAMAGAVDSIYPGMTAEQKRNITIYTAGYDTSLTTEDFGEGKCIQELVYCNVESISYPLARIINAFDDEEYSDKPSVAQRVETSQIILETADDLTFVQSHSIYHTALASDAFLDAAGFNALLARNGATHAQLVSAVQSMSLANLRAKNA